MKFAITITDATEAEISRIVSFLSGTSPSTLTMAMPQAAAAADEADETGPVNANAPAVDSAGLPWDERIHSSNKAMTDKGAWRKRRGVQDAIVTAVEAELRARTAPMPSATGIIPQPVMQPQPMQPAPVMTMPVPQSAPVMQPQPMQPAPVMQPQPMQPAPVMQPQPMPMQPAPVMQPQPVQQAGMTMDFPTFMQALSGQMQKRDAAGMPLIDTDYLARVTTEIGTAFGVPLGVITDIVSQSRAAEMIVYAVQCMQRDGKWN